MPQHEYFEELCALAIRDEIHADESRELDEHLQSCEDCREKVTQCHRLGLLFARAAEIKGDLSVPLDMKARLVARARLTGIPLSKPVEARSEEKGHWDFRLTPVYLALAAVVSLAVIFWVGVRYGRHQARLNTAVATATPSSTTSAEEPAEDRQLKEELAREKQQVITLSAQVKQQQLNLDSLKHTREQLTLNLSRLTATIDTLQDERAQRSAEITNLKDQLEKLSEQESTQQRALLDAQGALRNAKLMISDLESELATAKQVNTALGQARELITARNLHVKDIPPEIEGNGIPQKAFGRVFYAEGRRLDFYAYDLALPQGQSHRESFYVWRKTAGPKEQITKLGRLEVDNEKEGRWVLRVTDPSLITSLNSVFVTLESDAKPVTQPTGKRMLFAFLGNEPNHP